MVRETRYLIVRNLPDSCSEETVIDHFQRYGKIQSVKLQAAKENGGTGTATVAFNDIKSAAKAHHATNSLGEATLRTDYWEGSTQTPVLAASPLGASTGGAGTVARGGPSGSSYANPPSTRPVSSFASWAKGSVEEDGGSGGDKGDSALSTAGSGSATPSTTLALDKSASFDIPRGRARDRFSKKKFGQKFEKSGSFGRHGTSSRSLEAARSQSEAAAAAAASATTPAATSLTSVISSTSPSTPSSAAAGVTSPSIAPHTAPSPSSNGPVASGGGGLINHPVIILSDGKDVTGGGSTAATTNTSNSGGNNTASGKDQKDSSSSRTRTSAPGSPSSRHSHGRATSSSAHRKSASGRSRSGSAGSRSRSRSRGSRSSSSHSDSSGTSRSTSPHRSFSNNTMRPQSMVGASRLVSSTDANKDHRRTGDDGSTGDGERRSLGICVTGLPMRSTDSSLRDGLYHEYKKHGKVTSVQIFGEGDNRCAVVSFRKPEDASKALEASQGKTFFGAKIKVTSHEGVETDETDRASDNDSMDEYHQKSTRTLFVGNLEKETTTQDLMDKFKLFGEIIDVDIKRQGATTAFAFVQYVDISSVVSALRAMEGEHIGINKIKLGFGKSMPTCCVWLDNIPNEATNRMLRNSMSRYGEISYSFVDRSRSKGLICFSSYEDAQFCVSDIKQRPHFMKKKLQIDFASRECHTDFLDKMEASGQLRASERPDESRVHKFRPQRGNDTFQDDGSPSHFAFSSSRGSSVFNSHRNNGRTTTSGSRRSRAFDFAEENHSSSSRRSSRRGEEYNQSGGTFYSKTGDDYDAVLREYGHSQRERRERDQSPRRVDSQSRRGSRDVSLDRYEDQRSKDRNTSSLHNSRDGSPSSEHNSYRSESHRYRSSRGEDKYSSRGDRYLDDGKGEEKDLYDIVPSHRGSRISSPQFVNSNSMHSHDTDYATRRGSRAGSRGGSRGSRSQSPDVTLLDDPYSSGGRMFYSEDYKRSVVAEEDLDSPYPSSKRRDILDIESSSKSRSLALLSTKLGAEVAKTAAEKGRKRTHEESLSAIDSKLLRKLEKSSPLSSSKARHLFSKLSGSSKRRPGTNLGSPSGGSSGGSQGGGSENGSAGEDLHHLHQQKQIILMQIKQLSDETVGPGVGGGPGAASDSDSPLLTSAKVKSVAVKDALRRSGRGSHDGKVEDRVSSRSDKLRRSIDSRRSEVRYSREDKNIVFDEDVSLGGTHSDSDYDSERQRSKKRKTERTRDGESVKSKDFSRQDSVEVSDSEEFDKKVDHNSRLNNTAECRAGLDIRSNSLGSKHNYEDVCSKVGVPSPCDNGDIFKDRLSDKDLLVINKHQNSSKSNAAYLSRHEWGRDHRTGQDASPEAMFSPALSDGGEEDSVTSSSLTEKSLKHPTSPPVWKRSPSASPIKDDNSEPDLSYLKEYADMAEDDPLLDDNIDDGLSDSSLVEGEQLPGAPSDEASWEERIRAIDRVLNMAPSSKVDFSLGATSTSSSSSLTSNATSGNNDPGSAAKLYDKYRIRKREEGVASTADPAGDGVLEQPSVIVQRVLSKTSILDQDFKRLEQVNKYDTSAATTTTTTTTTSVGVNALKDMPHLLLPPSSLEPMTSPRSLGGRLAPPPSSSAALSPSLNPVTTSSSVLQPTTTTSLAGSTLSSLSSLSSSLSGSRVITTSSVCAPISSISVSSCENSGSKNLLDKYTNKTSVVTVKNSSSSNSSSSGSKLVAPHSPSSSLSTSVVTSTTIQHTNVTTSLSSSTSSVSSSFSFSNTSSTHMSSVQGKPAVSPLSLPSGSPGSTPHTSLANSSSAQPTGETTSTPAAAPFTQGSGKSQLVPTLGQEAPSLAFTSRDLSSASCPHLPGDQGSTGRDPPAVHNPDYQATSSSSTVTAPSSSSELTISMWSSKAAVEDKSKAVLLSKPEVVTPDIESPVSVKSATSSTDSVPLSSLDTKPSEVKGMPLPGLPEESETSSLPLKVEPVSPTRDPDPMDVTCEDKAENLDDKTMSNILGTKKSDCSLPLAATQATVLSVSSKDRPEKDDRLSSSELSQVTKSKIDSLSANPSTSLAVSSDADSAPLQTSKPSSSSSYSSSSAPTTSKPNIEKSEKKTPAKTSSKSAASGKTEALFAPDVKLEPPQQKPSSSRDNKSLGKDSHSRSLQNSSSNSSGSKPSGGSNGSSSDKKSLKNQSGKDSGHGEKRESSNTRDGDKKQDSTHKAHDSTAKTKDVDKSKTKEKRDQIRDGEKSNRKKEEDMKKKEDKKKEEKKEEKKVNTQREEKKVEKKEKSGEKEKSGSKQDLSNKHSKSDQDLSKKEKKAKDKTKDSASKDKPEKKPFPGLCVSKNSSPDPKPDVKAPKVAESKEGKQGSRPESSKPEQKPEKEKSESVTVKSEPKTPSKQDKHKSEQRSGVKDGSAKKLGSDSSSQKVKKEGEKSGWDGTQKVKKEEDRPASESAVKGKKDVDKSTVDSSSQKGKKDGEKDTSKQSSSKHSEKTQKQKQREEERLKEKQRIKEQKEKEEKERKEKEEREKQKEREEREKQKEKEREEKERQKEKEREERERQKEREREEKEKLKAEREKKEREEREKKEKEEKERLKKEREERERQKEKEREERERQKEKEREEREKQKEKEREEKEKKEKEEKERLKKEKEEKEKARQKEREEKEAQKEKERLEKEKREKEEKERLKKEKERKEKKEKEKKKAKEEKIKKEKEAKAKREKEEKQKKEREEKEKTKKEKSSEKDKKEKEKDKDKDKDREKDKEKEKDKDKDKEKEDKDDKKKPPPPKKQKRNELAALLDSNYRFQMTFTSMYDRVKTQRNREAETPNKSPSSSSQKSSLDKFKQSRNKKGNKVKSSLYSYGSTSDLSEDDNLSETNDSEDQSQKAESPSKDKKKTKQVKKRPRVSSSSSLSSSCEDDDDALLSATKSNKGRKKADIFSSDSEDDSVPPPVKSSKSSKSKPKPPAPKKKKVRADSLDSVGSRDGFVKPLALSSVTETESQDDMDLSESDMPKVSKVKNKKGKTPEKRDSSVESVSKKSSKAERDSSTESQVRKSVKAEKEQKGSKVEKEESPPKKVKTEGKKSKHDAEGKTLTKEVKDVPESKMDVAEEDSVDVDVKKEVEPVQEVIKTDHEKHKTKDKGSEHKSLEKISAEKSEKPLSENKSSEKKKKKDREDGPVKKKKKKKYDPKEEEALVNSLITKVYDSKPDKEKKKKSKMSVFDIESDDLSLSETSLDIHHEKKSSASKEETPSVKQKEKKAESAVEREEHQSKEERKSVGAKHSAESAIKMEAKETKHDHVEKEKEKKQESVADKVDKKHEHNDKKQEAAEKKQDVADKKQEHVDKKETKDKGKWEKPEKSEKSEKAEKSEHDIKAEPDPERSESGKPPKKKKKKDHDVEKEKGGKGTKSSKSAEKSSSEKKSSESQKGREEDKKSETKTSQKDVDEFTSFWGHPKPILIPKRLKDSKKSEEETPKSKDSKEKEDDKSDQGKSSEDTVQVKEEDTQDKGEKSEEDKHLDSSPMKTPDSVATPKVESDTGDDIMVPISEAETTVITENGQPASAESDSLVINEEQTPESVDDVTGDMTVIGSSVEINDDDDYPSLIIDEVSETVSEKKKTKKEKKQKKQKDINDRLDEVIASVAMGGSSDEDDGSRTSPDVNLQDVIDEELKYDNKSSNEPERKSFIVSDFVFPDDKRKQEMGPAFLRDTSESKPHTNSQLKKEPEKKKGFLLDEETKKRDEDLLKKLAVLCDPSVDKPVEIEDPKLTEEERKKKEEEEKKKAEEEKRKAEEEKKRAEEEKKKAEEEEKARREREEREASDEAARAVESLLEFQSGFDDDLPPLFIEPAEKEPPVESVSMSPSKEKSDVSITPGAIPEKVTANLDDKLLERKSTDKVFGEGSDSLGLFAAPVQNAVPVFTSPRRNSVGLPKDKTPEPVTMPSPQRQMRSPQRPAGPQQSPQLQSPQHRQMQSPQQGPPLHSSPQKIQSPQGPPFMPSPQQKTLPSPHRQSPSPQRPNQSPHRVGLQSPLLSPQRSPFFKERSFISPGREPLSAAFPPPDMDAMPLAQQPQRRASSGLPVPPAPEHGLDPHTMRRKSQEFPVEQALHSPRRNTIAAPEEASTSVAHLDRRFPNNQQGLPGSGGSPAVFFSKERSHSNLPQPVSISLDNAPHDKNFQSPMRGGQSMHQDSVLLSPKRGSPGFHHKEQHSLDQAPQFPLFPNKTGVPEQIFSGGPVPTNQMFLPHGQKGLPQQDAMLQGGKGGLLLDKGFKQIKAPEQAVFRGGVLDKPGGPLSKDPLFLHQKGLEPPHFQQGKELLHQMPEPFGLGHNKPSAPPQSVPQQEPMFSPKTQPSSPHTYPEVAYDFLNSPTPKMGPGLGNYPLPGSEPSHPVKPAVSLSTEPFSHDPLFIAMSEASTRPPEPPAPRRQDGLPPSFYQEPVPAKPVFPPELGPSMQQQPQFEEDKKGTRKRRRSSKKLPKEDKEAALEEKAIQEIVHSNVELIHQAFNATQAKAAAEKAGAKKPVDAYDFEAHTGQESTDMSSRVSMSDHHMAVGERDLAKPLRMRNEGRGRGRGRGAGRGKRGRGGANTSVVPGPTIQDNHQDMMHRPLHDPFTNMRRPDFAGPPHHPLDLPGHQEQPRHSGPQYHPPVSHHGQFSPSMPQPFSRQMAPHPVQPGFPPQQFYQPESVPGPVNLQDLPQKPAHHPPGIPTSYQQHPPAPQVPATSTAPGLPPTPQQHQQQSIMQLPQAGKPQQQPLQAPKSSSSDVLSPELNKQHQQDLDSSYGESELVINLDDQPPSIEGKENQYSLSSDSEDRSSMAASPATPRNQRATRTRKQPNYKAIAAGTAQQQAQPAGQAPTRSSRSGGSPRGARAAGMAGPPASPKSPRAASSSPVVKLEKLEVGGRTTRRGRAGMAGSKEDVSTEEGSSVEDWKAKLNDQLDKPATKDSIYDFADNEPDQQKEPASLRPAQRRNKKRGVALEAQDTGVDFMPGSPASSSNSSSLLQDQKPGSSEASSGPGFTDKQAEDSSKSSTSSLLSNVDAVIEAVAKGRFGDEEEAEPEMPPTPGNPESALSPPHTRSSRRSTEAKRETSNSVGPGPTGDQKQEKTTFSIAEAPRFDGAGAGRKGPTVPPLRIKVAHGTPKVEKEKHYVIASEHPQKPLSLTVKVAHKAAEGEQGRDLGLFSGLPQGESGSADHKAAVSSASSSAPSQAWKPADAKTESAEDNTTPTITTRAGGALHPKVAAKVASQEAAAGNKSTSILQATGSQQVISCHPALLSKSSPLTSLPTPHTSVSGHPAHGPKHTWAAGHHLEQLQQAAGLPVSSAGPGHLPPHLLSSAGGPGSPMMPQRPPSSHQEMVASSKASPVLPPPGPHAAQRGVGLTGKHAGMDIPSGPESQKHHQSPFSFPGHLPPTHGGPRSSFLLGPEGQANIPPGVHYPGMRSDKSPALQAGVPPTGPPGQHKLDGRTPPPVTSTGMLFSGVVSGMPRSLSPKSASPEGQVIERLPNPIRQGEQSPSPLGLRLPGPHHQDPGRFMKGPSEDHGRDPPPAHSEQRAPSRELVYLMEQQRLQQHLLLVQEAARAVAAEGGRNTGPPAAGSAGAAGFPNMRGGLDQPEGPGSRKGSMSGGTGTPSGGQPLNLAEQEPVSHRGTPKSTPPAPQSPFPLPLSFMDQRGSAGTGGNKDRLPATVASAFMQPSPGGHQHMYPPELSLAGLAATGHHSPFGMMGRLPMDPRGIYSPGGNGGPPPPGGPQGQGQQAPPPHLLREGLPPGHFAAFQRKGGEQELGLPPHGLLRSPSQSPSLGRQLQPAELVQLSALGHDHPARASPVGILQQFPVMWQGGLALKNESSYVQMHFIAGNRRLPSQALPQPLANGVLPPLRISQRMRLEHSQLDGVAKRMQCEDDYCILIAVACGRDEHDISHQTRALNEGFITYLLSKQAAGIVNVPLPGSEQAGFVVHIFPPCDFVDSSVAQQGSEALMEQLRQVPHAVIIIATTFT